MYWFNMPFEVVVAPDPPALLVEILESSGELLPLPVSYAASDLKETAYLFNCTCIVDCGVAMIGDVFSFDDERLLDVPVFRLLALRNYLFSVSGGAYEASLMDISAGEDWSGLEAKTVWEHV
jgi:hypothetical protein